VVGGIRLIEKNLSHRDIPPHTHIYTRMFLLIIMTDHKLVCLIGYQSFHTFSAPSESKQESKGMKYLSV
jgi:hypothetical protein